MIGNKVNHYKIIDRLGVGDHGVVYLAEDTRLKRRVALKFIAGGSQDLENVSKRFEQEAIASARLNHPNIRAIYEYGESEGRAFIVMEYLKGRTLREWLDEGKISHEDVLKWTRHIARGLHAAHKEGIIHRDVKPENIMITEDGVAKVMDFGFARFYDFDSSLTADNTRVGTVFYMSPEQLSAKKVDLRSDIWALGVMVYEMATGRYPFASEGWEKTMYKIMASNRAEVKEDVSAQVIHIINKCLEPKKEDRYSSCSEILNNLDSFKSFNQKNLSHFAPAMIIGIVVVMGVVLSLLFSNLGLRSTSGPIRLAVLPFQTMSDEPADEAFSFGLTHSTITSLLQFENAPEQLSIVPLRDLNADEFLDIGRVREKFDVHQVVSGVIAYDSTDIHITLELADANTLQLIHSTQLSVSRANPFEIQEMITGQLAPHLFLDVSDAKEDLPTESYDPAAYALYLQGLGYLNRFDLYQYLDFAIGQFSQAIEIEPTFAPAYASLCQAKMDKYYETNNQDLYVEALSNCKIAERLAQDLPDVLVPLGNFYLWSGQIADAKATLLRAVEIDGSYAEAYIWLARVYERELKPDSAILAFNKAIELQPNAWFYYLELGRFLIVMGDNENALTVLENAIALSPDNYLPYASSGVAYTYLNNLEKAESFYLKAHALRPTATLPLRNLGTLYFREGRYGQAVEKYEQAALLDDYVAHFFLGHAYYWNKDLVKADVIWKKVVQLSEQRLEVNPVDYVARLILADAYLSLGDLAKSQEHLKIVEEAPELDQWTRFLAGRMYERMGNREAAISSLEYALENNFNAYLIYNDPWLADLRDDPAYEAIIRTHLEKNPVISLPSP